MVFLRYSIIIYIYYNRIKCLFYLLNVMNNLIAILRFCDFAILRFCDYFIYHPFNISSFPTSLKTIFPIPFVISQIYRNFAAWWSAARRASNPYMHHPEMANIPVASPLPANKNQAETAKCACTPQRCAPMICFWIKNYCCPKKYCPSLVCFTKNSYLCGKITYTPLSTNS